MKPETDLGDLISWISSITCKQFVLPGTIPANSKKVTIIAPQLITPEEAYRLFLSALDSVGLTVAPSGKFLRIIETPRAKTSAIPLYGEEGEAQPGESYITRLVRIENADVNEVAQVLGRLKGEQGDVIVFAPQGALIITDTSSNITRMMHIVRRARPGRHRREGLDRRDQEHRRRRDGAEAGRDLPGGAARRQGAGGGAAAPGRARQQAAAQGRRPDLGDDGLEDHPRRAVEPADRHRQRARLRAPADAGAQARRADRGGRRADPRLLLRERQLRRAGADAGRRHRRVGVGRGGRTSGPRRARRRSRRRRRSRAAPGRTARRCCSRATCASTSIGRPTR